MRAEPVCVGLCARAPGATGDAVVVCACSSDMLLLYVLGWRLWCGMEVLL